MTFNEWIKEKQKSNWFLLGIVLISIIVVLIALAISLVTQHYELLLALIPSLGVLFILIWIGLLRGIFGKERTTPMLRLIVGILALIVLSWIFYWSMSTIHVTESTTWMKEGATTIFSGIAGAMAYDVITNISK